MQARDITVEWLRSIPLDVRPARDVPTIAGVVFKELRVRLDGRGEVTELWSKPWIRENDLSSVDHVYQSATDLGVIKCWHLHEIHTDQLTVTRGKLQITLVDLRQESPSFGQVNVFFLGSLQPRLLKVPPMIMHGWKALSGPEVLVVNLQSHVYTPSDEYKFPWDCVLADVWEPKHG